MICASSVSQIDWAARRAFRLVFRRYLHAWGSMLFQSTQCLEYTFQLLCGHVFHYHCVRTTLSRKWSGPRIHFGFMQCPLCKRKIEHPGLGELLRPLNDLFNEVANKAKLRLEYDGLLDSPALTSANRLVFREKVSEEKNSVLSVPSSKIRWHSLWINTFTCYATNAAKRILAAKVNVNRYALSSIPITYIIVARYFK